MSSLLSSLLLYSGNAHDARALGQISNDICALRVVQENQDSFSSQWELGIVCFRKSLLIAASEHQS